MLKLQQKIMFLTQLVKNSTIGSKFAALDIYLVNLLKMYKILSFSLLLLFFLSDCEKENSANCVDPICTLEFRGIGIQIKHLSDDSPVILTSYNVIKTSDNSLIEQNHSNFDFGKGYYGVADDTMVSQFKNSSFEVEFQGYINNSLVVTNKLTIKFTCCHVYYVSGDLMIYI